MYYLYVASMIVWAISAIAWLISAVIHLNLIHFSCLLVVILSFLFSFFLLLFMLNGRMRWQLKRLLVHMPTNGRNIIGILYV